MKKKYCISVWTKYEALFSQKIQISLVFDLFNMCVIIAVPDQKPWLSTFAAWGGVHPCHGKFVRGVCVFGLGDLTELVSRKNCLSTSFITTTSRMLFSVQRNGTSTIPSVCYHSKLITIKHYHSLLDRFLENWLKKKQLLYMYNVFLLIPWVVKLFINDYIKCNAVKILRDKRHWYLI